MASRTIQFRNHRRRGPFLRAVHYRRAPLPGQGVVHIAGHLDFAIPQAGIKTADIDGRQPTQGAAAGRKVLPLPIQQPDAQGLQHPRTGIIGSTAADTDNQVPQPIIQGPADQLAGAETAGQKGVAPVCGHQGQTAGRSHFYDRGPAIAADTVESFHRRSQRAADAHLPNLTAGRRN
jgi:hypothetical protein